MTTQNRPEDRCNLGADHKCKRKARWHVKDAPGRHQGFDLHLCTWHLNDWQSRARYVFDKGDYVIEYVGEKGAAQ